MAAPQDYSYGVIHNGVEYSSNYEAPQHESTATYTYDGARHGNAGASPDYNYGIHQHGVDPMGYQAPNQESKVPLATSAEVADYRTINWPDGPRYLSNSVFVGFFNGVLDTLLILAALAFLALAIMAMRLDGTSTKDTAGHKFEEAMKLGPTIYPILFAAIAGRALKNIGRFRAERGSRISTLWPLLNNKTMFDAVISQWQLAQFSVVASALILLWALSPLGGQATLRLVYRANLTTTEMHDVRYLDTGPLGNIYAASAVIDSNDVEAQARGLPLTMGALYEASLMQDSPTKRGPVDNWGNVKIPRVDQLDPSLADADGWIEVGNTTSVEAYYSLLGLPLVNLPGGDGIVEFNVESVYVALSAASHRSFGPPYINGEGLMFTGVNITCPNCISRILNRGSAHNATVENARNQMIWGPPYAQMNESMLANANVSGTRYIRFDSGTKGLDPGTSPGTSTVFCDVTQHFVEARVRCEFGSCKSIGVRKSTTDHRNPKMTTFDYWGPYALDMISVRSRADGSSVSSPSELFINDSSSNPIKPGFQTPSLSTVNLSLADPQVFADSATILLNTAIQIFMAPSGFTGGLPTSNLSIYGIPHIPADGPTLAFEAMKPKPTSLPLPDELIAASIRNMAPFVAASTTAKVTLFEEVYKPDRAWVGALILSSAILVLTGLAGLFLGVRVQAPDVFDPLVALTYNNPHINRSAEASTLGGNERARLLSSVTVRLGDVNPYGEVGRISLGQTAAVQPLHSGRLYE